MASADRAPAPSPLSPWRARRGLRPEARLVLPERPPHESAHAEGLRRELLVEHEPSRAEVRRHDPARDDALAVARRPRLDRCQRHGGAQLPPARAEGGAGASACQMTALKELCLPAPRNSTAVASA